MQISKRALGRLHLLILAVDIFINRKWKLLEGKVINNGAESLTSAWLHAILLKSDVDKWTDRKTADRSPKRKHWRQKPEWSRFQNWRDIWACYFFGSFLFLVCFFFASPLMHILFGAFFANNPMSISQTCVSLINPFPDVNNLHICELIIDQFNIYMFNLQ